MVRYTGILQTERCNGLELKFCRTSSDGGTLWMPGIVPKLSLTPGRITGAGSATVGAHNAEIYCGRLGLTKDDLAALARKGIV